MKIGSIFLVILISVVLFISCAEDTAKPDKEAETKTETQEKAPAEADDLGPFTVETADGTEIADASLEQVVEVIKSLDSDNFFLIMHNRDGFIQAMIEGDEFYVEYNDGTSQYSAAEYLSIDETVNVFSLYYRGDDSWLDIVEWEELE